MPLTGKQFDLGIDNTIEEWMKKIYGFLSAHPELAYTDKELAGELEGLSFHPIPLSSPTPIHPFAVALDKLVEMRVVETRVVRDQNYYRVGTEPLDL